MKKQFVQKLGFTLKENSNNIYIKKFQNNYILEVDFEKEIFNYGEKIQIESKTTSNFSQAENWVVFECVNRLLEKGYNPEDLVLEKTYKLGHQNKGRLDILVKRDSKTFLMIECKTWGKEFEKEFNNMKKDGGQLFSYFQQDREAKYLVLYTSKISENYDFEKDYKNEIVTVEEHYKETTSVLDFYDRWNKLTKQNGVFEDWVNPYKFESRALTKEDLKPIKQEDASIIFNSFLEILRKNTVSDKPNAFNKIFTLFLCKIYDEGDKVDDEELEFQWIEGKDNHVDFQLRLNDLYKKGMDVLLEKEVTDLSNDDFNKKYGKLDENLRKSLLGELNKIRLEKNNEFSIKEVFDHETFLENAIVLKEVVELLQKYKIRYEEKQPFLGDFFELLLTTGLKQEAGQFFTPVPIAKFICKSIPIEKIVKRKLKEGNINELLPATIDYAAGSGHFLTESMEEIQSILRKIPKDNLKPVVSKKIKAWEGNFDWAYDYMYGIEKDYRLVKTAKVGCFLHGDGIANVIHGDGLDSFEKSTKYRGLLRKFNEDDKKENAQFDLVLSNPPYSVRSFKTNLKEYAKDDFELFSKLTESSSEIEALFIERTSQLLKEDGIAAIILPSSILSNTGIYTKAREIILKNFEIIAITELGSNTFMATGTNTVVLFLRKRNKYFAGNLQSSIDKFFSDFQDVVFIGTQIEKPVSKYIQEVWENISFEDYISLLKKYPNEKIKNHDIFKEYQNKNLNLDKILEIEKEKLFYFVIAYPQKVVLVKSGEKKKEKEFLGYEFSSRKGSEGIHPIQKGKLIDECTKLFDPYSYSNHEKVNHYIYEAFLGNTNIEISEELKENIFKVNLSDLLTLDRANFEKTISTNIKKKIRIESKWEIVRLGEVAQIDWGNTNLTKDIYIENGKYDIYSAAGKDGKANFFKHEGKAIILSAIGARCGKCFFANGKWTAIKNTIVLKNKKNILINYLFEFINNEHYWKKSGTSQPFIKLGTAVEQKIPLPPIEIQQKIVDEIGELEKIVEKNLEKIGELEEEIKNLYENSIDKEVKNYRLSDENIFEIGIGKRLLKNEILSKGKIPVYSANVFEPFGYIDDYLITDFSKSSILWGIDGDWMVNFIEKNKEFYPTDHCGYLRIINGNLEEKFVKYFLEKEGKKYGFSRTKRASIDRIKNLKIHFPSIEKQKEIVGKIEVLEEKIEELKEENKNIPEKKKEILKKYL